MDLLCSVAKDIVQKYGKATFMLAEDEEGMYQRPTTLYFHLHSCAICRCSGALAEKE